MSARFVREDSLGRGRVGMAVVLPGRSLVPVNGTSVRKAVSPAIHRSGEDRRSFGAVNG